MLDEQRIYDDLILDDYVEGYYKLSGKVLRMLKWYTATYDKETAPRFFVKTDQDVFVNLPNLVTALRNTSYYQNLISRSAPNESFSDKTNLAFDALDQGTYFVGGKKFENAAVDSDPGSKWYIDSSERGRLSWPGNLYPTYLNGPMYVFSSNIVPLIYNTSFSVPLYPFEDVYVVGMIIYDRLNLYISNMEGMLLDTHFLHRFKNKPHLHKKLAIHPVEHPVIMMKFCRIMAGCRKHLNTANVRSDSIVMKSSDLCFILLGVSINLFFIG